ncbi:MAG: amidohydrolase family protein, partial [Alphaproteobacteria bacterium]
MAGPPAPEAPKGKTVIKNIGLMLSGALENPVLDTDQADVTIDAHGTALCPGLIDSHVHPVFGDWTPRQNQTNWIDSSMHGGVTTMISAGEVHLPGRPKDPKGVVALAITAQRCFSAFPIGGVKMHAGAPILEKGMVEE